MIDRQKNSDKECSFFDVNVIFKLWFYFILGNYDFEKKVK